MYAYPSTFHITYENANTYTQSDFFVIPPNLKLKILKFFN